MIIALQYPNIDIFRDSSTIIHVGVIKWVQEWNLDSAITYGQLFERVFY